MAVGHEYENYFTIRCMDCGQPITIKLIVDQENIQAWIEPVENCSDSEIEGQFVNIHPNFVTPQKDLFNENYFHIDDMHAVASNCSGFINQYNTNGRMVDFYKIFSYGRDLVKDYHNRKKVYDLVQSGREDLAHVHQQGIKRICTQKFSQSQELLEFSKNSYPNQSPVA